MSHAADEDKKPKRQTLITISKETTFITKPLDERGFPDYRRALNDLVKPKGVAPENNAVVLLFKAVGPNVGNDIWAKNFARELGIPPLPKEGDYLVTLEDFAKSKRPVNKGMGDFSTKEVWEQYGEAVRNPELLKKSPILKEWLERNQKPLKLIESFPHFTHYYRPIVPEEKSATPFLQPFTFAEDVQCARTITRLLLIRANSHRLNNDLDGAWRDVDFLYSMSRMIMKGATPTEQFVGAFVKASALWMERQIAFHENLDAITIQQRLEKLNGSETIPPMNSLRFERFQKLGVMLTVAIDAKETTGKPKKRFTNWNSILKKINHQFDEFDWIASLQPSERTTKLRILTPEQKTVASTKLSIADRKLLDQNQIWTVTMNLNAIRAHDEIKVRSDLTKATLALMAYRKNNKEYPKTISELDSHFTLPKDWFTGKKFRYAGKSDSFKLYSVGRNQKDDGGVERGQLIGADDIVITSPNWKEPQRK